MRILVVEDEHKIAQSLKTGLEQEGYAVALAGTGEEGFFLPQTQEVDLILLDPMPPPPDRLESPATPPPRRVHTPPPGPTPKETLQDPGNGLQAGPHDHPRQ